MMETGDLCSSVLDVRQWLSQWSHLSAQLCFLSLGYSFDLPGLSELGHPLLQICTRHTPLARYRTTLQIQKAKPPTNYSMGMQQAELLV